MAKIVLRCEKIKSKNAITKMHKHNFRTDYCENIDKSRTHLNEELIPLPEGKTYKDILDEKIKESDYYKRHKVRSNAVFAIDVQIGFSREQMSDPNFNIDLWKQQSVKWAEDTFGKENVISMVLHMDESTPHIHAVVVPMVNGCLNCSYYLGTPDKLRAIQDSIGRYMSEVGLERGGRYSVAKHTEMQKFYGALQTEIEKELPKKKENEKDDEYYERANGAYQNVVLKMFGQEKKAEAEIASLKGSAQAVKELERQNELLRQQNEQLKEMVEKAKKSIANAQKNQKLMNALIFAINNGIPSKEEAAEFYSKMMGMVKESEKIQTERNKENI